MTLAGLSRMVSALQPKSPGPDSTPTALALDASFEAETIAAPSKRVAMDWALVLASQSIEVLVELDSERGSRAFALRVPGFEYSRARAAIQAYERENPRRRWKAAIDSARVPLHPAALLWATVVVMIHWADARTGGTLTGLWSAQSTAVTEGEWWRLLTAVFLHADIGHLAANLSLGLVLLALAMGMHGAFTALALTLAAGTLGNVAGFLIHPRPFVAVGASGMVLAAAGLLAGNALRDQWRGRRGGGRPGIALIAGMALFVLLGLQPGSDQLAHAVGFVGGMIGGLLSPARSTTGARGR